jgi:hypothetical protein
MQRIIHGHVLKNGEMPKVNAYINGLALSKDGRITAKIR